MHNLRTNNHLSEREAKETQSYQDAVSLRLEHICMHAFTCILPEAVTSLPLTSAHWLGGMGG